jgi:hypothetical protein
VPDPTETWVLFDAVNRELRTNVPFLAESISSLTSLELKVKAGDQVDEGAVLAEAKWDDGTSTEVVAPAGCSGSVARTFDLDLDRLASRPSQVLLYMR